MLNSAATLGLVLSLGLAVVAPVLTGAAPAALAAASNAKAFALQQAEAPVTGSVSVHQSGGKTTLVFSKDFSTNPKAPALQVVLLKSATPLKTLKAPHFPLSAGAYTQVSALKSPKGSQSYTLPAGVNIKDYGSVLIWCKVANATMAWAPLK